MNIIIKLVGLALVLFCTSSNAAESNKTFHVYVLMIPDWKLESLKRQARQEEGAGAAAAGAETAAGFVSQILGGVLMGDIQGIFAGSAGFIPEGDFRDGVGQVLLQTLGPALSRIFREVTMTVAKQFNTTTPRTNDNLYNQYQQQLNNNNLQQQPNANFQQQQSNNYLQQQQLNNYLQQQQLNNNLQQQQLNNNLQQYNPNQQTLNQYQQQLLNQQQQQYNPQQQLQSQLQNQYQPQQQFQPQQSQFQPTNQLQQQLQPQQSQFQPTNQIQQQFKPQQQFPSKVQSQYPSHPPQQTNLIPRNSPS